MCVVATHPLCAAILVMFLFPDRQAVFDLVDDVFGAFKSFTAMHGGGVNPNGDITDLQMAGAMDGVGGIEREFLAGFSDDFFAFAKCECGIGFIL